VVNVLRFLHADCIRLDLETTANTPAEVESEAQAARRLAHDKERVLTELATLMEGSGQIINPSKFLRDLIHREQQATTAIAPGIAIPHVRSYQARTFVIGFARAAAPGIPFASLDGAPTRLFFVLASPPWDDHLYLRVYRDFAEMMQYGWVTDALLEAATPADVLSVLRGYVTK